MTLGARVRAAAAPTACLPEVVSLVPNEIGKLAGRTSRQTISYSSRCRMSRLDSYWDASKTRSIRPGSIPISASVFWPSEANTKIATKHGTAKTSEL